MDLVRSDYGAFFWLATVTLVIMAHSAGTERIFSGMDAYKKAIHFEPNAAEA